MKKANINQAKSMSNNDEMLPEYDFTGQQGVRGKYQRAYKQGHTVRVFQEDGSVTVQYFTLEDGAVMLEPEIKQYFPDSESVNKALRSLIELIPGKPAKRSASPRKKKPTARF
jgi:hypothetical protein